MTTPISELDAQEVHVGTANGPGLYIAPAKTPGPADLHTEWAAPWAVLGYLSDDGPTVGSSTDTEDIKPWQSRSPIRSVITGRTLTMQMVLWQLNQITLGLYFGERPVDPVAGVVSMQVRTDTANPEYAIGLDAADGDQGFRIIFHRASLTDSGDMQISAGAAIPLDCTLTALDDAGVLADVLLGPITAGGGTLTVNQPAGAASGAAEALRHSVPLVGRRHDAEPVK